MKKQINSKAVWFNIIMLILFVLTVLHDNIGGLGFGDGAQKTILTVIGILTPIGNYILRVFFTTTGIK